MSEALSSSEIEDVLSSIRRLVSDDLRPSQSDRATVVQRDADKLMLTPALRVVQANPVDAAEGHAPAPAPAIEDVMANLSAAVGSQDDQWESETGDLTLANAVADEVAATDWQDHRIDAYVHSEEEADPAPEGVEGEILTEFAVSDAHTDVLTETVVADSDMPPGWAQTDDADEAEVTLSDPWVGGTIEPDQAWADEAEAAIVQELAGGALPRRDDDRVDDLEPDAEIAAGEVPVDEAMLREIVRDVLREELQGRLGERITRNIRKLVRAEIARVMAAEELY